MVSRLIRALHPRRFLETLEEIVERYAVDFAERDAGKSELRLVPCLNDSGAHVDVIEDLIRTNVGGWEDVLRPVGAVPSIPSGKLSVGS